MSDAIPILAAQSIHLAYKTVRALRNVSFAVHAGEVTCLLGDNGAGKSSLVKILSGAEQPSAGRLYMQNQPVVLPSPAAAQAHGIATVYQDLAIFPLLNIARNFYVGHEHEAPHGRFGSVDWHVCGQTAIAAMAELGVQIANPMQAVGTLSGGQRQSLAIARAIHFGAKVLILDEPTASLGVKQSAAVLDMIGKTKARGVGVVFITHNAAHAYAVGDRFTVLRRSESLGTLARNEVNETRLHVLMSGGEENVQVAQTTLH